MIRDGLDRPIAGAGVTHYGNAPGTVTATAITNAEGRYDLTFTTAPDATIFSMTIVKAGYETSLQYFQGSSLDVLLREVVRIRVGDSVNVAVGPDDGFWGFDDEYHGRTIRLTSDVNATAEVKVAADDGGFALLGVYGRPCCEVRHEVNVAAGQEIEMLVLVWWNEKTTRRFTVTTSRVNR
jgi:hypothetical protein